MMIIDDLMLDVLITIFIPVTVCLQGNDCCVGECWYGELVGMRLCVVYMVLDVGTIVVAVVWYVIGDVMYGIGVLVDCWVFVDVIGVGTRVCTSVGLLLVRHCKYVVWSIDW